MRPRLRSAAEADTVEAIRYALPAMPKRPPRKPPEPERGLTQTGVKKTIWFHEDEAEALRLRAFKDRRSESAIVRAAVRTHLGVED